MSEVTLTGISNPFNQDFEIYSRLKHWKFIHILLLLLISKRVPKEFKKKRKNVRSDNDDYCNFFVQDSD